MTQTDERRHIFEVTCKHCGHVNYYDKRRVCGSGGTVYRDGVVTRGAKQVDRLALPCDNCKKKNAKEVDCEGYV